MLLKRRGVRFGQPIQCIGFEVVFGNLAGCHYRCRSPV
jgi:hypothetical protein